MLVMGIDGGGTHTRVVVMGVDGVVHGQAEGSTANPSVVGHETAAATIQAAIQAALDAADMVPQQIAAVGIGVAGADAAHSADWLCMVLEAALPQARVVPSSDYEIALVGALGERQGVLVLAGTGSLAYGVNAAGQSARVGGWGYLLDDAGSGYWIGLRGLEAVARAADGRGPRTGLCATLLDTLELTQPVDLVGWLYHAPEPRTHEIAALAPLVLEATRYGDDAATHIVTQAVNELALAARTVMARLEMFAPQVAFTGGLLSHRNPLSEGLCAALGLATLPEPCYSPVIGAALLAQGV